MKRSIMAAVILFAASVSFAADVTWKSPAGTAIGSPILFDCTYNNPGVTAQYMKLWIDGNPVFTNHGQNRLTYLIDLPTGSHIATCQGNDGSVTTNSPDLQLNVQSNLKTYVDQEESTAWKDCYLANDCTAQDPDDTAEPLSDTALATTISVDAPSRWFEIQWVSDPDNFQNMYWFIKNTPETFSSFAGTFVMRFDFRVRPGDEARAYEWGMTQCINNSRRYRMAVAANYDDNVWKVYDPVANTWRETDLPFSAADLGTNGEWHRVEFVGRRISGDRLEVQAIVIDGVAKPLNSNNIVPTELDCSSTYSSYSFQIDGEHGRDDDVRAFLDRLSVLYVP
jgi:hypothetical protein